MIYVQLDSIVHSKVLTWSIVCYYFFLFYKYRVGKIIRLTSLLLDLDLTILIISEFLMPKWDLMANPINRNPLVYMFLKVKRLKGKEN